jgi:hypothetical protein
MKNLTNSCKASSLHVTVLFIVTLTNCKHYKTIHTFQLSTFLKFIVNLRMVQPRPKHAALLHQVQFTYVQATAKLYVLIY